MSGSRKNAVLLARFVLGAATPEENDKVAERLETDDSAVARRLPSSEQAAWILLEVHIGAIAHGTVRPEEGLRLVIEEVLRSPELLPRRGQTRGSSHDADRLVRRQDEYDDVRRENGLRSTMRKSQTDALVVLEAREWMTRNATGRV